MQDQGPWDDCPRGVVAEMAGRLRRRKRYVQMRPFIFIGATALLLSAIGYGLTSRDQPGSLGAFDCLKTASLFAGYHDRSLDDATTKGVEEHLSRCPNCRQHYDELYPSEVRNRLSAETGRLAVAVPIHH